MTPVQEQICMRLIEGESLRSICEGGDMPAKSTVLRWAAVDEEFRDHYSAARLLQADGLADEILDIADDGRNDWMERRKADGTAEVVLDAEHVQRSRVRIDARKWLASKLAPKKYGEATLLKHGDATGEPLKFEDTERVVRMAALLEAVLQRGEKGK